MHRLRTLGTWIVCALLAMGSAALAADPPDAPPASTAASAASAAVSAPAAQGKSDFSWKDTLAVASGAIALLGTALPLLSKAVDARSLAARSKSDLQRIDELAGLLDKVRKDGLLSPDALQRVRTQIEAELDLALAEMGRTREQRDKALQARQKQHEIKHDRDRADLPAWRRALLLYLPHGMWSWVAQPLFYLYATTGVYALFTGDSDLAIGSAIIAIVAWLVAWRARRMWEHEQRLIDAAAALQATAAAPATP